MNVGATSLVDLPGYDVSHPAQIRVWVRARVRAMM
jgi:hypothetical protein